jgi:hypothetical protein
VVARGPAASAIGAKIAAENIITKINDLYLITYP